MKYLSAAYFWYTSQMQWSPERYWNVQDERISILARYLEAIPLENISALPTEEIIARCIDALRSFSLSEPEKKTLRQLIQAQDAQILGSAERVLCAQLTTLNVPVVTMISLGCGGTGMFEKALDDAVRRHLPAVELRWLGADVGDYRTAGSFFHGHPFVTIQSNDTIAYASLVTDDTPVALFGAYSYHHIGIPFSAFQKRCAGVARVVLIEEPTSTVKWQVPEYRVMRIAYDVLANAVFSPTWAEKFMQDPGLFKVQYIHMDTLPSSVDVTEVSHVLPETALVSFSG